MRWSKRTLRERTTWCAFKNHVCCLLSLTLGSVFHLHASFRGWLLYYKTVRNTVPIIGRRCSLYIWLCTLGGLDFFPWNTIFVFQMFQAKCKGVYKGVANLQIWFPFLWLSVVLVKTFTLLAAWIMCRDILALQLLPSPDTRRLKIVHFSLRGICSLIFISFAGFLWFVPARMNSLGRIRWTGRRDI
jgi:hypothetical protein